MTAKHMTIITLITLLIGACAPAATPAPTTDVNAIYTAAAQTVIANITSTAEAAPPTPFPTATEILLPTATETASPTATFSLTVGAGTQGLLCDNAVWVSDVTVPDGSIMTAGQDFIKTWKVRNTGACTWGAGYTLIYGGYNDKMGGAPAAITSSIVPGQEVEVSVQFKAPTKAGEYLSAWRMANPGGFAFGQFFFVKIVVR